MINKYWTVTLLLFFSISLKGQDIYDIERIQEVKLYIEDQYWDNKLNAYKKQGIDKRVLATLVLNGITYDSVGVRYKGNSSYFNTRKENDSKLPLNVKIDYMKKNQYLPGNFKRLKLSNVFRDPSFLREVLSYEIIGNYMPTPRANFAKVYINDEYLGLYNNTESIDSRFTTKRFGTSEGVLFKCDPVWKAKNVVGCLPNQKSNLVYQGADVACYENNYELKSGEGWRELIRMIDVLNNQTERVESVMNVNQVLWMHALNNVLVNLDSYIGRLCHNYYLYQDTFGIFQPIIWDLNMSFGGFRFDGSGKALDNESLQQFSLFTHYKSKNAERPLIYLLLKNTLYRKVYLAMVQTILKNHFIEGQYKERAKKIQSLIEHEVAGDENRLYSYESFLQNLDESTMAKTASIIGITELMDARITYLKNHPVFQKKSPVISNVKHKEVDDQISITANIDGNVDAEGKLLKVYLVYRNAGVFNRVQMLDEGTESDGVANDKIYGKIIERRPNTEYYIIAEGERVATLAPEKAAFETFKVH